MKTKPELKLISSYELPDPPYPADFIAGRMKFDLDLPRIKQSKTWMLCPPEFRNHLLRVWIESWASVPAGTYDDDDEIIAARIDLNFEVFQGIRKHLMRHWELHSDGKLYHPYITEMVSRIMNLRKSDQDRKQNSKSFQKIPPEILGSNPTSTSSSTSLQESASRSSIGRPILAAAAAAPPAQASPKDKTSPCPYEEIRQLWAKNFPYLAQPYEPEKWSDQRKRLVRERWKEQPDLEWWDSFLEYLTKSDFLMGRKNGRDFQITFDWLMKTANFVKCQEGNYHG